MKPATAPSKETGPQVPVVLSYLQMRKAVGFIGLLLPLVLALGKILLQGRGTECSVSDYYYTDLGNVFVGSLCAIGVFLVSCRGYDRRDELAGYISGACAVGVALFRTSRAGADCIVTTDAIGKLHFTFATLLFVTLAYFCLKLFTQTAGSPTTQKLKRNRVYRFCGWTIAACILLIAAAIVFPIKALEAVHPVFWLESIAITVFGFAWLTKGETILKDQTV
jgi:hypothetical protein